MTISSKFRTRLCGDLGIAYPIVQSGMGGVAGTDLAAEVSNAGGLGIVSITLQPAKNVKAMIDDVRRQTDKPFGVNLLIPPGITKPINIGILREDVLAGAAGVLDAFRDKHGIGDGRPLRGVPDWVEEVVDVVTDERVPVVSLALGDPTPELVERCQQAGSKVMVMVTDVSDGQKMAELGVDFIVAQGHEAGGHRSFFADPADTGRHHDHVGTFALVSELAARVSTPVLAAGGIVDGRGLASAIVLGASGVMMGSRFVATRESIAPSAHKKALQERNGSETAVSRTYSGWPARLIPNDYTKSYDRAGAPTLPFPLNMIANFDIRSVGEERDDPDLTPLWGGQAIGQIEDEPWARDVVLKTVEEARRILQSELSERLEM